MKTLKITPETHKMLTELQSHLYATTNLKYTFNEIIANLVVSYNRKVDIPNDK